MEFKKQLKKHVNLSEEFYWVLDLLPIGVTVQKSDYVIAYENKTIVEMLGSYLGKKCYTRWQFIPGWGKAPCVDCPF